MVGSSDVCLLSCPVEVLIAGGLAAKLLKSGQPHVIVFQAPSRSRYEKGGFRMNGMD